MFGQPIVPNTVQAKTRSAEFLIEGVVVWIEWGRVSALD
jgi:hypothetical protein